MREQSGRKECFFMPKYKATAYIRLSYTDDHSSESDSVSNQRKLIENFVERNPDIEVVSEKIDDGYSGIIFDRPAFKEMMQDVTDGNINCVIVKDLSRLGREYIETGRYLRRVFPAYGVRFIAITDSIDTAHDSGDDLTVSVKNIMNEAYCRDISIKTRSSLDVKRRNGDFVGAFPVYGYMKAEDNKNLLVPDPYAARVVCDIFRMRLEGASASKIASELNRLGILSPLAYKKNNGLPYAKKGYADKADCKWSATTIIRILQDETYTMLEVIRADYVQTAKAKGAKPMRIVMIHELRNALLPMVTVVGIILGQTLGGAIVTETIFALPSVGTYLLQGIFKYDMPVVMIGVLFIAAVIGVINLLIDILYIYIDPRLRSQIVK